MDNPIPLVARAIRRGQIVPREVVEAARREERHRIAKEKQRRQIDAWNLKHRTALFDRGLTTCGKPRKNQCWPELKGLSKREYQRRYVQIWRKQKSSCLVVPACG